MSWWACPKCGGRRELTITQGGEGVPACNSDDTPMVPAPDTTQLRGSARFAEVMARQQAKLDPKLAQEPALDSDEVVDPKDLLTIQELNEQ